MTVKKVYKKLIKLDPPKVRHSVASDTNDRIWWYEELEGEILDFAKYCSKKAKVLKGDEGAIARLSRVGKSINNLKMVSAMAMGDLQDLYTFHKEKKTNDTKRKKTS
jgi:hypothetical protein